MTSETPPLQDAQVLMSLVRLNGIRNRQALELFSSTAQQRNGVDLWEYFNSLAREYSNSPGLSEWAWEQSGLQLQQTCDSGIRAIPFYGKDYPNRLRWIEDPPVVLFAKGDVGALHSPNSVAIVGTREPTPLGERAALDAGKLAAKAGIVVVSGLALGCDTRAHEGCVESNGIGVAVLANGLDRVYPAANRDLASKVLASGGCLVSETPVGAKLSRWAFAYRDRIQSGLSDRVLVIETDVKGGTMHTVKFARQQQRPLACINHPEHFLSAAKTRGNQMLIARGAAIGISDQEDLRNFLMGTSNPSTAFETSDIATGKEFPSLENKVARTTAAQHPSWVPAATSRSATESESTEIQTPAPFAPVKAEQLTMPMEYTS